MGASNADKNHNFSDRWMKAYAYARVRGVPHQICEDFAQDVSIELFKGRDRPMRDFFADHARMWAARGGGKHVELAASNENLLKGHEELEQWRFVERMDLKPRERLILLLLARFGLSQSEVGYLLNLHESRISQIVDLIRKKYTGGFREG